MNSYTHTEGILICIGIVIAVWVGMILFGHLVAGLFDKFEK